MRFTKYKHLGMGGLLSFILIMLSFVYTSNKYIEIGRSFQTRKAMFWRDFVYTMSELKRRDVALDFLQRQEIIDKACKNSAKRTGNFAQVMGRNTLYNPKHKFVHCMIEKVGCTFWRRIFYLLQHQDNATQEVDPFSIPHYLVHNEKLQTLRGYNSIEIKDILHDSRKSIFVRNPYERIFSGYVDKLFSINTYYWNALGRPVIKTVRQNATDLSLECGHDVKFQELLEYLLYASEKGWTIDIHFSSMHSHCNPCDFDYDFIGKMETFTEDATFIIEKMKLFGDRTLVNLNKGTVRDNLKLVLEDTLKNRAKFNSCMSTADMITRAWNTFKLRGMIDPEARVPDVTADTVSVEELLIQALQFVDENKVAEYRRRQYIKLYRSVDRNILEKFRKFIFRDAKLFGYEDRPKELFSDDISDYTI